MQTLVATMLDLPSTFLNDSNPKRTYGRNIQNIWLEIYSAKTKIPLKIIRAQA